MRTWAALPPPPLPVPPRGTRRDPLADTRAASPAPRYPWAARFLALTLALWLCATAAADITSPQIAQPAIARLLDGLTDTRGLLSAEDARVREAATDAAPRTLIEVPGFPVGGAGIPREDVLSGTPEQWRAILLDRAAALVYRDGTRPFAQAGEPGGRPLALRLLDEDLHRVFALVRWLPAVATILLVGLTLATLGPVHRWRALGLAAGIGGAIALTGALAAMLAATLAGSDGTLSGEAAAVVATLARGPIIQSGAVTLGGLALWWSARRPVVDDDVEARLAAARAAREARRRAAAGLPPRAEADAMRAFVDSDRAPD